MTEQEKLFNQFLENEPEMTEQEYLAAIKELARKFDVKKSSIEDLINLSETSYYNSQEFEKALKSFQDYKKSLRS